jgi:hypothetical protein
MSERAVFVTGGIGFIGIMQLLLEICDPHPAVHQSYAVEPNEGRDERMRPQTQTLITTTSRK